MNRWFGFLVVLSLVLVSCSQKQEQTQGTSSQQIVTQKQVPLSQVKGVTIETCNKAIDASSFVACVDEVAAAQKNADLCDQITTKYPPAYTVQGYSATYHRDVCILAVVEQSSNKEFCKKITDDDLRFSCLNKLG